MSAARPHLRRRARTMATQGKSQRQIAAELNVSRTRVRELLAGEYSGAERLHEAFLAHASAQQLDRYETAILARIRRDIGFIRTTRQERESRQVDAINGLA